MAEPYHGLTDGKEYHLKVGSSFSQKNNKNFFHAVRYDFKPASVDSRKSSKLSVGGSNDVTVTVPHIQESESTVFKGSKRPFTKECILVIDKSTGEITLERLTSNIQLKKIRSTTPGLSVSKAAPQAPQNISKISSKPSVHKQRANNKTELIPKDKEEPSAGSLVVKHARKREQMTIASKPSKDINMTSSSSQASDSDSSSSASDSDSDQDDQEAAEQAKALDEALMQEPPASKGNINLIDEDLKLSGSSESDSD